MFTATPDQNTIKALIRATRAFVDSLEADLRLGEGGAAQPAHTNAMQTGGAATFDPLTDEPPRMANPTGTREQRMMAYLAYLGAIYAINKREDRGATPGEVARHAIRAGYEDGRGVSGFSNKGGATYRAEDGTRWVNEDGVDWLKKLQNELGIDLPDDLS